MAEAATPGVVVEAKPLGHRRREQRELLGGGLEAAGGACRCHTPIMNRGCDTLSRPIYLGIYTPGEPSVTTTASTTAATATITGAA